VGDTVTRKVEVLAIRAVGDRVIRKVGDRVIRRVEVLAIRKVGDTVMGTNMAVEAIDTAL
jgi:hypothetical protein